MIVDVLKTWHAEREDRKDAEKPSPLPPSRINSGVSCNFAAID